MRISCKTYNVGDIINLVEKDPISGGLPFCRYLFLPKMQKNVNFGGAGLYACFYRKKLVYIGKYQGAKDNFIAGDIVKMRWIKHIGTFTMQARSLGFSKKALSTVLEAVATGVNAELKISQEIREGFLAANYQVLQRETGCMTTFQRCLVAMDVWHAARQTGGMPNMNDFEFIYSRIEGDITTKHAREIVTSAENYALDQVHPPGNTIANRTLTVNLDQSEVEALFEKALISQVSGPILHSYNSEKIAASSKNSTNYLEPEEDMTLFEQSLEEAPEFTRAFVEQVQIHFSSVQDADVEFTNTPDMRIRKLLPNTTRGFRNCMRFTWQSSNNRFLMYSRLSDIELKNFGLSLDRIVSDTLPHVTFISDQLVNEEMKSTIAAISKAHSSFNP
jgi:hypothetical protein